MPKEKKAGPFDETARRVQEAVASAQAGIDASSGLSFTELKRRIQEAQRAGRTTLTVPDHVSEEVRRSLKAAGLRFEIGESVDGQTEIRVSTSGPVRLQEG